MVNYTEKDSMDFKMIKQLDKFMFGHKGYIAGGVFKHIFTKEPFKDVDIFFENPIDQRDAEILFRDSSDYELWYENSKVTAFKHIDSGIIVELIKHTYNEPLNMLDIFDFTITKFAYYKSYTEGFEDEEGKSDNVIFSEDGDVEFDVQYKLAYHPDFFLHLTLKRLVIDDEKGLSVNPYNTLNRTYRYAKYGYYPCLGTKELLVEAIRNANPMRSGELGNDLYEGID